jgi:hypothetical protein
MKLYANGIRADLTTTYADIRLANGTRVYSTSTPRR